MQHQRISVGNTGAYCETYFLSPSAELPASTCRPVVIICPGGGYCYTSAREAEPIAMAFCARGFHACVLYYPCAPAIFPAALCALGETVAMLRKNAEQYAIDAAQISVCGFSAGGHLTASLGVFWDAPFLAEKTNCPSLLMRPNKMILCYPVITSGEFAHEGSFAALLGAEDTCALRERVSLEKQVTQNTPPTFLWHTCADSTVAVENSMLFAQSLQRFKVPFEMHLYEKGVHGLSLCTPQTANAANECIQPECAGWIDLACTWLRG